MDTLTPEARSQRMSLVRHKDTKPERLVRQLLTALGFRYRLQGFSLPGRPDIVFAGLKKVVFVHGCFWHRHRGCGRMPKSRLTFWETKLEANRARDRRNQRELRRMGWDFLVVWECELKDFDILGIRLIAFLDE
jgi:DNA mismatch endonuclease (patch repair protein)